LQITFPSFFHPMSVQDYGEEKGRSTLQPRRPVFLLLDNKEKRRKRRAPDRGRIGRLSGKYGSRSAGGIGKEEGERRCTSAGYSFHRHDDRNSVASASTGGRNREERRTKGTRPSFLDHLLLGCWAEEKKKEKGNEHVFRLRASSGHDLRGQG